FVDLIEADFLSLTARRKQSDRTRYQRELQVAFPIRTRGHEPTPYKRTTRFRYGGYAVPHTEWRTHGRVIRYSLLICSAQKTARQESYRDGEGLPHTQTRIGKSPFRQLERGRFRRACER